MNKLILLGGAALMALSGPTVAQSTGAAPPPDGVSAPPAPTDTAPVPDVASTPPASASAVSQGTDTAADAAANTPAAPPTVAADSSVPPTPAAPAPATASADASAKVSADWAKYDAGNKGRLTALEFGTWVLAKNGQDVAAQVEKTKTSKKANLPAIKVLNATSAEFAKADKDKDRMISPDELAAYLSA